MKVCKTGFKAQLIVIALFALAFGVVTDADPSAQSSSSSPADFASTDTYAAVTKNKKANAYSAKSQASGTSSHAPASTAPPDIEPPVAEIANFLKAVDQKRLKCLRKKTGKPVGICAELKVLQQLEILAHAYISVHKKEDKLQSTAEFAQQENSGLKNELRAIRSPASLEKYDGCYKKDLLRDILIDYGVNVNGSALFSKKPVGAAGVCWSNSKKKKEATISICDYPLAIFIKTIGGVEKDPVIQDKQYLFSLNSCDLVAFHSEQSSRQGPLETFMTYDDCRVQWNKRTADAAMNPTEVRLMEDTIGACFREHLLPPRNEKGGRVNPNLPPPPQYRMVAPTDPDQ